MASHYYTLRGGGKIRVKTRASQTLRALLYEAAQAILTRARAVGLSGGNN